MAMNQESPTHTVPDLALAFPVPATDRASLEGLSKDELRAWALRKSKEYRLLSCNMLSLHNAATPIHTLPVELLMKIFGMTWYLRDGDLRGKGGLHPTSVCRRWRMVYLSTPAFWAHAVSDIQFTIYDNKGSWTTRCRGPMVWLSDRFATMLLDRSSHHPIALRVEQTQLQDRIIRPTCVLPSTVSPHLHRLVSFCINMTLGHFPALHRMLNGGMPALEKLDIVATGRESRNLTAMALASWPSVSDESLPRLRSLSLTGPPIFFPLIAVQSLKRVILDSVQDNSMNGIVPWPHPTSSESRSLLRLLSRCRNLESLGLKRFRRSRWWPPLGDELAGVVQLPCLKTLYLDSNFDSSERCASILLAALDPCIPSTASVHRDQFQRNWPDSLSDSDTLIPFYLAQHHPFDTVILSPPPYHYGVWVIQCFEAQSLRLGVQFRFPKTVADLVIEVFPRAAYVTHLEIIRDSDTPATDLGEDWTAVLRAFPHLTHLTASGPVCPSGVVEALGAAAGHGVTADSDSVFAPRSPLCPALRYVTLGWAVPREIALKGQVGACDPETYLQHRDVGTRVERRCSAMQLAFERRASMTAQKLDALEFYEYERQGMGMDPLDGPAVFAELIASSRRDDNDLLCLERLRTIAEDLVQDLKVLFE